jgi:hypothetical protein
MYLADAMQMRKGIFITSPDLRVPNSSLHCFFSFLFIIIFFYHSVPKPQAFEWERPLPQQIHFCQIDH